MKSDEIKELLAKLHAEAESLSELINAPQELRLQRNEPDGDGFWLKIEELEGTWDDDGYCIYVMCKEDGVIWTNDEIKVEFAADILHRFCEGIVHTMASRMYREVSGADRRMLFAIREMLMAKLNKEWVKEMKKNHKWILTVDPVKNEFL